MTPEIRAWMRLGVAAVAALLGVVSGIGPEPAVAKGGRRAAPRSAGVVGRRDATGAAMGSLAPVGEAGSREEGVRRPAPLPRMAGTSADTGRAPLTEEAVWAHYQPTREELSYRALMAEREAQQELRELLHVLDLDEERQDRVFAALVRSSEYYHPSLQAMGAGGTPIALARGAGANGSGLTPAPVPRVDGLTAAAIPIPSAASGAPMDAVLAELTPEQADVYERYTSEKAAFWVGVVEDVERQISAAP